MSAKTLIRLAVIASWVTCILSFNFWRFSSFKRRFSKLRSTMNAAPKFFVTEVVDVSIPYDAAARLAYESSDKSMAFERFKKKYLEEAVALVKSKQPGYDPINEPPPPEPIDISIPYDAAALLAYKTSGSRLSFVDYKRIYVEDTVNMVKAKQKRRRKVAVPLKPTPPGYRPQPPRIVDDRFAKYIAKMEKEKDVAIQNLFEFLKTAEFKRSGLPELQKGVPRESINGAALLTAVLALLATKGVVISSAAGAGAAYVALQQGALGDAFRTFGSATWDATEAAVQLIRAVTADERVTGMTKELAASVAGSLERKRDREGDVAKSFHGSDAGEPEVVDQTFEELPDDLARILEEAEAAIGQADAAMALADDTLRIQSEEESYEDDETAKLPSVGETVMNSGDEEEETEKENIPGEPTELELIEEEKEEEDGAAPDEADDEWAMTLEMAQQGIDGKIVGMDEVIDDHSKKADWDAAGILAKKLGQSSSDDAVFSSDEEVEEEDEVSLRDDEEEYTEVDGISSSSDSDLEAADTMLPDGDLEDIARAAREAVARMNDKEDYEEEEEVISSSSDSDLEAADTMLPDGDLEDIARAAREAVAKMNDKEDYEEEEEVVSSSSDSDLEDADTMLPDGDLEDIARAAREAVAKMNDKEDYEEEEEVVSSSSYSDLEDADTMLPDGDLEDIARAAREAVARMNDKEDYEEEEEVISSSSDSDLEAAEGMLPEGNLEDIARAAREAVSMVNDADEEDHMKGRQNESRRPGMRDWSKLTVVTLRDELRARGLRAYGNKADLVAALEKYDAESSAESMPGNRVESDSDDSDWELDFGDVDVAELGRQAQEAVLAAFKDLDEYDEKEEDDEESDDLETEDLFADLDLETLAAEARAAVDAQPLDEPSDDVLQELEDELNLGAAKDYSSMTVIQLKDELRSRGMKVSGNKSELIKRLESG
eukprot:scaffold221_cov120-Cylindrotheca_fusiformis.AAC.12